MNLNIKNKSISYYIFGTVFILLWIIFLVTWCFVYVEPAALILFILWISSGLISSLLFIVGAFENTRYKNNLEKWKIEENKKAKYQQFDQQIPEQFNLNQEIKLNETSKIKQEKFSKSDFENFVEFNPNVEKIDKPIKKIEEENFQKVDREIIANCEKICSNHWKCMQECVAFSLKFKDNLNIKDYKYDEEKRN
jgi:hypothetical protein